jgi:hypothetical protein
MHVVPVCLKITLNSYVIYLEEIMPSVNPAQKTARQKRSQRAVPSSNSEYHTTIPRNYLRL